MKSKTLISFISLICLATGFWITSMDAAGAVTFTPPADNNAPSQGSSGGASRN